MATTTVSHVLHRASKPPTARVDAYLDRPALGSLVIDELISFVTDDPAQLFAIADAALKAGQDLEQQMLRDAAHMVPTVHFDHRLTLEAVDEIPGDERAAEGMGGGRRTYKPVCSCGWDGDDDNTESQARAGFNEHVDEAAVEALNAVARKAG